MECDLQGSDRDPHKMPITLLSEAPASYIGRKETYRDGTQGKRRGPCKVREREENLSYQRRTQKSTSYHNNSEKERKDKKSGGSRGDIQKGREGWLLWFCGMMSPLSKKSYS